MRLSSGCAVPRVERLAWQLMGKDRWLVRLAEARATWLVT